MTRKITSAPIKNTSLSREQIFRAYGVLIGAAVGDAAGAPFEFGGPGQWSARFRSTVHGGYGEMIGGGSFHWAPGEFTDDTQMAVALAESLIACGGLDLDHLWEQFKAWAETARDIGVNTGIVLAEDSRHGAAEKAHRVLGERSASNGCIMRLGPVGIWGVSQGMENTVAVAAAQAALTHFDPAAAAGAAILAETIRRVILGGSLDGVAEQVVRELVSHPELGPAVAPYGPILDATFDAKEDIEGPSNGSVWTALAQALWAVRTTASFESAIVAAIELGGDTDTVAAITGSVAGALYGAQRIPVRWMSVVHGSLRRPDGSVTTYRQEELLNLARQLLGKRRAVNSTPEGPRGPGLVHDVGVHAANLEGAAGAPTDHAVVSMCLTEDRFTGRSHHRQLLLHDEEGDYNADIFFVVRDGVDAIDAFLAEGKQVVVHCHGGRSRTGLLLKAWYMKHEGKTHAQAHAWLEGKWGLYRTYNQTFLDFLENEWTDHIAAGVRGETAL